MGKGYSRLVPSYFKNFNIENRVQKQMNKLQSEQPVDLTGKLAPRHRSTVEILRKLEESAPNVQDKRVDDLVIERSRVLQVKSNNPADDKHLSGDKRPKKENEIDFYNLNDARIDPDLRVYGYSRPEKIRSGCMTLRQMDEIITAYNEQNPTADALNKESSRLGVSVDDLHVLLNYYKPLFVINKGSNKQEELQVGQAFPNMQKLTS